MKPQSLKIIFILLIAVLFSGCSNTGKIIGNKLADKTGQSSGKTALSQEAKRQIKILFVGDTMFDRYIREAVGKKGGPASNASLSDTGKDYNYPLSQLKEYLSQFDLVVANLEGPITPNSSKSTETKMDEKSNLIFTFDPQVASVLAGNNIKLVSLGNNHVSNFGPEGIEETKKYLQDAGVDYFGDTGTGDNQFRVENIGGIKIGFLNYNYSVAGSAEKTVSEISAAKKQVNIVVVFPHWGTEYKVGDPGKNVRALAYRFIDAGADAIIGTHPHVIENTEEYQGKKIFYSLGNFVFDQYFQKETMEGLGVVLTVEPDLAIKYDEVKFEMQRNGQTELMQNANIKKNDN